jgi:phenylalanyl-tRNA synthetase alpha chain
MKYQQKPWRWLNAGAQQLPTTTPATLNTDSISHPDCNITYDIVQRVGKNLHLQPNHPIHIIKQKIELYWKSRVHGIEIFDNLHPLVSTHSNFDSLLIDKDHVSRRRSDTYYFNNETVLRTHTSAHQSELLSRGLTSFLVTGDVYRRDEIDSSHYPVFHQMEGVRLLTELADDTMTLEQRVKVVEHDLKEGLEGMARELFGDVVSTQHLVV